MRRLAVLGTLITWRRGWIALRVSRSQYVAIRWWLPLYAAALVLVIRATF